MISKEVRVIADYLVDFYAKQKIGFVISLFFAACKSGSVKNFVLFAVEIYK